MLRVVLLLQQFLFKRLLNKLIQRNSGHQCFLNRFAMNFPGYANIEAALIGL
jgi:hypothetical protein